MTVPIQPTAPAGPPQPPVAPWTPFEPRLNDAEPPIAQLWMRKLSAVMSTTKYAAMPPEWRQPLDQKYQAAVQAIQAVTPQPALPKGVVIAAKADDAQQLAQEEQTATNPQRSQPTPPTAPTQPTGVAR